MTNAEKFKEVFGFGVCAQTRCDDCPLSHPDKCTQVEFWDVEYKEPKKEEIHYGISRGAKEQISKSMNTFRGLM